MSNHGDEIKAQRAHLERLLDDHPQTCPKCLSSTDWDLVIALHAPNPQKDKTLEVLCRKCDYNMTPDEIAKLYD